MAYCGQWQYFFFFFGFTEILDQSYIFFVRNFDYYYFRSNKFGCQLDTTSKKQGIQSIGLFFHSIFLIKKQIQMCFSGKRAPRAFPLNWCACVFVNAWSVGMLNIYLAVAFSFHFFSTLPTGMMLRTRCCAVQGKKTKKYKIKH